MAIFYSVNAKMHAQLGLGLWKFPKIFPGIYLTFSHTNILFSSWEMAFTNNSLHGGHPIGIPRDFLGNAKHFRLVRKCIYRIFFNVNHPNDSLIMKFIDQIMGLCIKITCCKNHGNILLGQCENACTIKPRLMIIPKNLPGDIQKTMVLVLGDSPTCDK